MPKILHIIASPRGDRSASLTVAKTFLAAYAEKNPGDQVETLDLWKTKLPEFDGATIEGKYAIMTGNKFTSAQDEAWKAVVAVAEQFKSADKIVISVPMWNFSIPYKLKHYIDVLVQPGLAFSFSPDTGYKGLITGKPLVVIYARGGAYGPGSGAEGYDAQSPYLKQILGFIGFTDIKEILVEQTASKKDEALEKGNAKAKEVAAEF
jgi:FMN-dependent NADH-azoreductase